MVDRYEVSNHLTAMKMWLDYARWALKKYDDDKWEDKVGTAGINMMLAAYQLLDATNQEWLETICQYQGK